MSSGGREAMGVMLEQPLDDYFWKSNPLAYRGNSTGIAAPGTDYLHAYWLGRRFGVLADAE